MSEANEKLIGRRVQVIAPGNYDERIKVGMVGEIVQVRPANYINYPLQLRFNMACGGSFREVMQLSEVKYVNNRPVIVEQEDGD